MTLAIALGTGFAGVALLVVGSGSEYSSSRPPDRAAVHTSGEGAQRRVSTPVARVTAPTIPTTGSGTLPQTDSLPSPSSPQFHAEMADLWKGVESGSVSAALPALFPEGDDLHVEAISDPRTDYRHRLLYFFAHDVHAAHRVLDATSGVATFVTVSVPMRYAHWVPPGVCDNSNGYYEVPNSRVVYRKNGVVRSFGIASMISWRGEWYVVHLGAVVRPMTTPNGVVDDPSTGQGTSAYSSTC